MNRRLVYTIKRPGDKKPTGLALNCHLWHGAFRYFDMEHGHEIPGEVTEIPEGEVIIASGPLTSDALAEKLQALLGEHSDLHFFDAAAPLVSAESVDMEHAWMGSRYDKGTDDYVNCPMNQEEYDAFWKELSLIHI